MGMYGKGGGSQMANPSLPLVGAPTSAPQFYTPGPFGSGMMFGGGSGYYGGAQSPYNPPGAGFYGGDALGTAGQLLSGGSPPSFNAAAGGNVQGIGYWPQNTPGAGGGKGGKGGGTGLPPPTGTSGAGAAPPPSGGGGTGGQFPFGSTAGQGMQQLGAVNQGAQGMQAPGNPGANLPQTPIAPGTVPNVPGTMGPPGAGAPSGTSAPMQPPSWNAAQLAQANGMSPGLADFMLAHNAGADSNPANQQFYQAAGFTNPAGSQTMLNAAGRDWLFNNNQYYGNINADAGQPNGPRLRYGMMGNTPFSYSPGAVANNPAFQRWYQQVRSGLTPSGPAPTGVNVYSQFAPGGTSGT